jgi:hypothetical protein
MSTLQTLSVALAGNPTVELLRLITSFSDEINRYIKGADGCEALLQLIVVYLMEVARRFACMFVAFWDSVHFANILR